MQESISGDTIREHILRTFHIHRSSVGPIKNLAPVLRINAAPLVTDWAY